MADDCGYHVFGDMGTRQRRGASSKGKAHLFGGDWTNTKLEVIQKYLTAYTTALKSTPFKKAYIDAFAGTGYRTRAAAAEKGDSLELPDLAEDAPQELLDGSARLALKVKPGFDSYIFIERSVERCRELQKLKEEFPDLEGCITVQQGDANKALQELCAKNWRSRRAVVFLDPYGMEVEWKTVEAIARTKAIDLWLLFPFGIGLTRLLPNHGNVPEPWRRRLDEFLGTTDWYEEMYRTEPTVQGSLFAEEEPEERIVRATRDDVGKYFIRRLESVFHTVAEPGVLRNSRGCPLYLLCFAAGNAKGATVALKIADHILKGIR
ncbi:MAG: three-Cys-motif partner protein TcmP [Polyangiaceae bacterium]